VSRLSCVSAGGACGGRSDGANAAAEKRASLEIRHQIWCAYRPNWGLRTVAELAACKTLAITARFYLPQL
jgi:hypothetical protein